jgi:hypothetical protein
LALVMAGTLLGASVVTAQVATQGDVSALLLFLLSTRGHAPTPDPSAFEALSPGDQALFEAQIATLPTRLGLDQVAEPRRSGEAWGEVFRKMKARRLVAAKDLDQVMSRFNDAHR